jgi:hypothetical protein
VYEVCIECIKEMMDRIKVYWKDMILTEDNILFGASTYQYVRVNDECTHMFN